MKKLFSIIIAGVTLIGAASCNKYLDIVPKGQKIPQTFADFKAFMENSRAHYADYQNQAIVANEFNYLQQAQVGLNLTNVNYNWQENVDRIQWLQSDMGYTQYYNGIFQYNVIINHLNEATTGTAQEKAALIAQAKVNRAMLYFGLVNSYAKVYDESTAATDPGVIINTKDDMEQTLTQSSVKAVYDFMINDLNNSLPDLPDMGINAMFSGKGTAYALLARIYMFQRKFDQAEQMADKALAINSQLFDWVKYYTDNKTAVDAVTPSLTIAKFEFSNVENYLFNFGGSSAQVQGFFISAVRYADSAMYDNGDARFKINFSRRTVGTETFWNFRRRDDPNVGGIRTPEMYYIKAECLARKGNYTEAMSVLNTVRKKRIISGFYTDVTAANEADAIALIRREMRCEYRGTGMWYLDYRRFSKDSKYAATLTKVEGTQQYSIKPDSHLWIMPFSQTSIAYGEGRLVQNSH